MEGVIPNCDSNSVQEMVDGVEVGVKVETTVGAAEVDEVEVGVKVETTVGAAEVDEAIKLYPDDIE